MANIIAHFAVYVHMEEKIAFFGEAEPSIPALSFASRISLHTFRLSWIYQNLEGQKWESVPSLCSITHS